MTATDGTPSVLFGSAVSRTATLADRPDCFGDLNLDQVVDRITAGREAYDLQPFFFTGLSDPAEVAYRLDVFRDLDGTEILECVQRFAHGMQTVRERLARADGLRYHYQRKRWFLDAAAAYVEAVEAFTGDLTNHESESAALGAVRDVLTAYVQSNAFSALKSDVRLVHDELDGIVYCTNIRGLHVEVSRYEQEPDYSAEVARTFAKFEQGAVVSHRSELPVADDMDHVEERIHDLVAELHPEIFAHLDQLCERHRTFLDPTVVRFDRELQFYVSYLECIEPLRHLGLPFCYPSTSRDSKRESVVDAFDLALALQRPPVEARVVCNDIRLDGAERILVVTGPNQGGKTTFARMFGQLHHLASLGCPVPGRDAELFLPDRVLTHFEQAEDPTSSVGKLEDDLLRVRALLTRATGASVVILNEVFDSTTLQDATFLGTEILGEIARRDMLCVCVTFVDELTSLNEKTVSMVSMVDPDDISRRTYKVLRRPADGLAYAVALAEKHGLTSARLEARITS